MPLTWTDRLDDIDWHDLEALYREAPLGHKPAAMLRTAFGHSAVRCFAHEGGRLVAAGRALADGVDCAYVCDVAVRPSHQGRGLGREIMQRLVQACHGHRKVILYAVPGKEGFYRKLGFLRMTTAMAIFADPATAIARGQLVDD